MNVRRKRILCVDNHKDSCDLLEVFLEKAGYDVRIATTSPDALNLAMTERFDLYLIDCWLSPGSGLELCQQIRTFDPQTPIIVSSSDSRDIIRQQASQAGAQAFLIKPISLAHLAEIIAHLLNGTLRPDERLH
jgi:CheY-like chemotaxis protein